MYLPTSEFVSAERNGSAGIGLVELDYQRLNQVLPRGLRESCSLSDES